MMAAKITPLDEWIGQKIGSQGNLTRQGLEEYQLNRLQETLDLVRRKSTFYQHHFKHIPRRIKTLQDLANFPFTAARDLQGSGLPFVCVSQDEIRRVVTLNTSGTTGEPKRIYFTRADQELTIDFFQVGMSTFSDPGDRILILLPCEREGSVGDLLAAALERMHGHPIRHGVIRDYAQIQQILKNEKVDVIVGIPAQLFSLACRVRDVKIKSVLLSTDYVPAAVAEKLASTWECRVFNHYGMTEMGLGGGVECQAHSGYHLREADMLFEIVDPLTGQVKPEGERGEVVFSTLTRQGMPLIRYRTGDLSRWLAEPCACGTVLKRMEPIRTRIDGLVGIGNGQKICMADLDDVIFKMDGVDKFKAILSRERRPNTLALIISVFWGSGGYSDNSIRGEIEKNPSIKSAMESGDLSLEINLITGDGEPSLPTKRMIQTID